MDRTEIDFLSAAIDMIEKSDDPAKTGRRMIRMIDHIMSYEIESRKHRISRKWLEYALKNDPNKTVCAGDSLDEYIGANCFSQ